MSMGAKAMAKKSVTPEEIERVQEIGRASAEHLGALKVCLPYAPIRSIRVYQKEGLPRPYCGHSSP